MGVQPKIEYINVPIGIISQFGVSLSEFKQQMFPESGKGFYS